MLANESIVALSPRAQRMFAVSVSQDVDPRGEVSAGGYWLHLSSDQGQHWEGPYYLGFAHQFPYVVQSASRVPAFDGDRVQIEVERREVDESTITFPPVGLRAKAVATDRFLSVDVTAVKRDSDGDGLTDLLEEKLVLDPMSRDTDGDGLSDRDDPLPLHPRGPDDATGEVGTLLSRLLPSLLGGLTPIQQSAAAGNESSTMSSQPSPLASQRTLFVEVTRWPLPHAAGIRMVSLSPAMLTKYRAKFGATYPMRFPDIAFDRTRQRALILYSFGWSGGSMVAEWKDGKWELRQLSSWIT
jgi:hypothetical protein